MLRSELLRRVAKVLDTSAHSSLRVLFAGGTTGGHLMPGAATAEAFRTLLPSCRCLFLVTERETERHCRRAIAGFETVEAPATPWGGAVQKICFPARCLQAAERVFSVMRAFRPHLVVGLGGCNCVVPVLLARLLGIKTAVFESNAIPGRSVRLLAPAADCVVVQWEKSAACLRARRVLVAGNPVRARLLSAEDQKKAARRLGLSPDKRTLLVMGGSQGALALNEALYGALKCLRQVNNLQVLHLTGVDHLPAALDKQAELFVPYRPIGFLDRIEEAYAAADFVLARAGGSTLAELTALGLASILVPYPHAADSHQQANAQVLARAGAALIIEQSELTDQRLARAIESLAGSYGPRTRMAGRARRLGRPQAAMEVAAELAVMAGFGPGETERAAPGARIQHSSGQIEQSQGPGEQPGEVRKRFSRAA